MRHKTEIGPNHVLMGWMVGHCAWVVNNFQVERYRENALSFYPGQGQLEKLCHLEKCAWSEIIQRMEPS